MSINKGLIFVLFLISKIAIANGPVKNYLFIKNEGQWPMEIFYKAEIPGGVLWITTEGLNYQLIDASKYDHSVFLDKNARSIPLKDDFIKYSFNNKISSKQIASLNPQSQTFNYFLGNDPDKWKSGVHAYEEIIIENVFKQIDFRMYSIGDALKYEYIIKPNANPNDILIKYEGSKKIEIINHELLVHSNNGLIKEFEPFTFQNIANSRKKVNSKFNLSNNVISFIIGEYDKSKVLIIDPELVFSTYSGSVSDNWSHSATYDSKGSLYAAGSVFGSNYPVVGAVFQNTVGGVSVPTDNISKTDIVITKYSSDGSKILYSTFLGGNGSEVPHSLIVNSKDELVVFGTSSSTNFPTTITAHNTTFNGGVSLTGGPITTNIGFVNGTDIFVSVISESGSQLLGSTYVGGSGNDGIHDYRQLSITNYGDEFRGEVFIGPNDQIYVASITNSINFPVVNSSETRKSTSDAVVFTLSKYCDKLLFSTYIGGSEYDAALGIRVDSQGAIYVCGVTKSKDFFTTTNALKRTLGGDMDGFIIKIIDFKIVAATYVGTSAGDLSLLLDLDENKNVVVFGLTNGEYPIVGAVYNNPRSGQFIHSISNDLSSTNFSSVFGTSRQIGRVDIVPTAFLINKCGNIYVAGWGGKINSRNGYNANSTTTGMPITSNAFQSTTTGNNYYFAIFEKGFKSLLYGTFYGSKAPPNPNDERGDHLDGGTCRFDKNGIIYHTACVCKANGFVDFPIKNAVNSNHNNSNCNMAAFKFDLDALAAKFDLLDGTVKNPVSICAPIKIKFDNLSLGGETFEWLINNQLVSRTKEVDYNFTQAGTFTVKLRAYSKIACSAIDSTSRTINVKAINAVVSNDTTVCVGASVKLSASGGNSYIWTTNPVLTNPTVPSFETTIDNDKTFIVDIKKEECTVRKEIKIKVEDTKTDFGASNNITICKGQLTTLSASGLASSFIWSAANMKDSLQKVIIVRPSETTIYTVRALYPDGCKPQKNVTVSIDNSLKLDFDFNYKLECNKPSEVTFNNLSIGGERYFWSFDGQVPLESNAFSGFGSKETKNTILTLSGVTKIGCASTIKKDVGVSFYDGFIPNVITPNNDGKNDTFIVGFPSPKLEIFNQWGKKIFEDEKYNNMWGGKIAPGNYYYLLTIEPNKSCKGWVEVIN